MRRAPVIRRWRRFICGRAILRLTRGSRIERIALRSTPLGEIRRDEMAKFSFLHAADLHLGSPFEGLSLKDEELARRFAAASREAFRALVDAALAEKVAFVVIGGD